jgi:hypothetical protein
MSAEIVNLRRARKGRARVEKEAQAASNRVAFGTPRALRNAAELEQARADRALAGKRLQPPAEDEDR